MREQVHMDAELRVSDSVPAKIYEMAEPFIVSAHGALLRQVRGT